MATIWIIVILSLIAAFSDIIGGALTLIRGLNQRQMSLVTAIGAGFLLGATFLDRLPDAMNQLQSTAAAYLTIGYLIMLVIEQSGLFGLSHHSNHTADFHHPGHPVHDQGHSMSRSTGGLAFLSLLIHTFMDGVIIAGSFSISKATGILIFLAITLHKLPEGFSMAAISLASGSSRRLALGTTIGLAISTLLGSGVTIWIGSTDSYLIKVVMALATGSFIFITASELIPIVKQSRDRRTLFAVILSTALFYGSLILIQHVGLT